MSLKCNPGQLLHAEQTGYKLLHTPKKMVPSRIELLILALLAPRLNQLGQGTLSCYAKDCIIINLFNLIASRCFRVSILLRFHRGLSTAKDWMPIHQATYSLSVPGLCNGCYNALLVNIWFFERVITIYLNEVNNENHGDRILQLRIFFGITVPVQNGPEYCVQSLLSNFERKNSFQTLLF